MLGYDAVLCFIIVFREIFDHSMTSGSGSGLPFLVQRTLAKQVSVIRGGGGDKIGKID